VESKEDFHKESWEAGTHKGKSDRGLPHEGNGLVMKVPH
jgi:hypothetical protein